MSLGSVWRKNRENAFSFGATVSRAASRFLLVLLASLLLSKYDFGIFNIFLSIYFFARLFSENSLNLPFIKYASDGEYSPSLVNYQIIFLKIAYVAVVSLVVLIFSATIVRYSGLERQSLLYFLPYMLLALTAYMFVGQVLTARLRFRQLFLYELLNGLVFLICLLSVVLVFKTPAVETLIGLFATSMLATALAGAVVFRRYITLTRRLDSGLLVKIVQYSKFTILSGISSVVILKADVLMLGYFRTPQEVGVYGMALFVNEAVNLVFDSVLRICLPKASSLSAEADGPAMRQLFRQSIKNIYLGILPIVVLIGLAAPTAVNLIYGGKYDDSIMLVYIFLASSLVKPVGYVAGVILGATGNIRLDNRNCWISAVLNIVCNFFLIPPYGGMGAALASALSFASLTVLHYHAVQKAVFKDKTSAKKTVQS